MNSFRRLLTKITGNCSARLQTEGRRNEWVYGLLAHSTWSTAHLQSIMHRRTNKKKAEKKIECDKITVSYIAAGLLFLLYFLRGLPHHNSMACGGYSASSFIILFFILPSLMFVISAGIVIYVLLFLSALVIWYRFIIPCIGSFFIFFFGNAPVLLGGV